MNKALVIPFSLCLSLLAGCDGTAKTPNAEVDASWVRLPAVAGREGAAYFRIESNRPQDALLSVSAPGLRVEMHESMTMNHMSSMRPIASADFADGKLVFAPGGKHLMLFGLDPALKSRGSIPLTFRFKASPPVTVRARLVGAGDPAPDHDE
jgi:copper(I)-binding protein